jgi:membrane protein implicated in regulation of membrane protease activity
MGGVAPTRTTRLWLAVVGLALCIASTAASFGLGMTWAGVLLAALSAATVVNIGWVAYRRRRD